MPFFHFFLLLLRQIQKISCLDPPLLLTRYLRNQILKFPISDSGEFLLQPVFQQSRLRSTYPHSSLFVQTSSFRENLFFSFFTSLAATIVLVTSPCTATSFAVCLSRMSKGLIWATAEDLQRNRGRVLSLYRQILRSLNSPSLPLTFAARIAKKTKANFPLVTSLEPHLPFRSSQFGISF
ncbi:hypothetical protein P8452_37188 [Trifolium repens]|nr:hypothetical protein P8452_37188 [Trifolium repens]